ncbi:leucine-rich repeat-containing protein 49-like isoform X2 [Dysidea avara]|uniref:leucine-rich repeat-containing protein 49-like isoform X2 n=1 Tax=Dysidea avara TaxID=196820 RepID=UPI00332777AB
MDYRSYRTSKAKQQAMLTTSNVVIEWNAINESARVPYSSRLQNSSMGPKVLTKEDSRAVNSVLLPSGGRQQQQQKSANTSHMIFSESPAAPGIPLVYRTPEGRAANPDRLNLDRRKLSVCPILEGEERLRMLNLQHNAITKLQHLSALRRLVFLDLYDNLISEISGLDTLSSLRVLMLGKNKIRQICGLKSLARLDVLDLHGNMIRVIENLSHLCHLRVLNLAGNEIVHTIGLAGMTSLTELNLRRNRITHIYEIDCLPQLQRLYLSHNLIEEFSDITCVTDSPSLSELSLDGNPLANSTDYRVLMVHRVAGLRVLDTKPISEEEKLRVVQMIQEEEQQLLKAEEEARSHERRLFTIGQIKRQWESVSHLANLGNQPKRKSKMRAFSASFVEEIEGTLHLYGLGSLDTLYSPPVTSQPTHIAFHYIEYTEVASLLDKLSTARYLQLKAISIHCCNLSHYDQLDMLSSIHSLDTLVVSTDGNPITSLSLWKQYAIVKLNLVSINDDIVTPEQAATSKQLFEPLVSLSNQYTSPAQQDKAHKGRQTAVREVCNQLLTRTLFQEEKQRSFEVLWPELLHSVVNNIVSELNICESKEYRKL